MSECGLVREWGREWGRARERWFGLQERASEEMRATQPRFKQVAWHVPSTYMVEVSASVMTSKVENIILALDKEVRSCTEEGEQLCVSLCVSVCVCVCLCVSVCESEKKKRPVDSLAFFAQTRTQHKKRVPRAAEAISQVLFSILIEIKKLVILEINFSGVASNEYPMFFRKTTFIAS